MSSHLEHSNVPLMELLRGLLKHVGESSLHQCIGSENLHGKIGQAGTNLWTVSHWLLLLHMVSDRKGLPWLATRDRDGLLLLLPGKTKSCFPATKKVIFYCSMYHN